MIEWPKGMETLIVLNGYHEQINRMLDNNTAGHQEMSHITQKQVLRYLLLSYTLKNGMLIGDADSIYGDMYRSAQYFCGSYLHSSNPCRHQYTSMSAILVICGSYLIRCMGMGCDIK